MTGASGEAERRGRRWALLLAGTASGALVFLPDAGLAQGTPRLVECAWVEGDNPSNVIDAVQHQVGFADGRVARVVLTLANRPEPTITEFSR